MATVHEIYGAQRTRRNIMKMGAILIPAVIGAAHSAAATPPPGSGNSHVDGGSGNPHVDGGSGNPHVDGGSGNPHVGGNCFLKGTKILTAEGERKIEDLTIGDLLPTKFGGLRPIQWIGRYSIKKSDPSKPLAKDAQPIRIARSALAPNVPHADLYVTAHHSMLVDGVLVPAAALINGATITRYFRRG